MRTLDISSKMIFTTTKKKDDVGVLQVNDRGHHGNGDVKVSDYKKDDIRDHIKSFPCVPSHLLGQGVHKNIWTEVYQYRPCKTFETCETLKNLSEEEKILQKVSKTFK